jgi:alkylation response protein AidB-like acyl-CoA dehydrogenase
VSGASHYRSNLRDVFFDLFEVLDIGRTTLGHGPFAGLDECTARQILEECERFVVEKMAPSFAESDRIGCRFHEGRVILPEALKRSLQAYYEADWHRLDLPERLGGVGAPPTVHWSAFELLAGAHASATYYLFSTFIGKTIDRLGTDDQRRRFVGNIVDRRWGGAMVLTEPDAGSDVGQARTRARHLAGDVWEIDGVKRFITNGDFDAAENIVHLVLARPEGHGPGTKGLSMFIVPKIWVEEDGRLGEPNGVVCTGVEKKLGIKASATCEITYGDGRPARGLLVGGVHDGIRQMFMVIEHTRMAVGVKSMSALSTAYLNALAYARVRVQGADLRRMADRAAPRIAIVGHPDVRRMLMAQKAHAEGMRALCLYAAHVQDRIEILGGRGAAEAETLDRLNDLLLPLVKGYCSERTWDLLALSLQCFGGSGYCQDFPIEQYIRDQKIDSLYEGTTHIQALDLFFRKIGRDGGRALGQLLDEVRATIQTQEGGPALEPERAALGSALKDVQGILQAMTAKAGESLYHVGLWGNRMLFALAELVIGWLLIRHAAVAMAKVEDAPEADRPFYRGKIASARYFAREVLPGLALSRRLVEDGALDLVELEDAAF